MPPIMKWGAAKVLDVIFGHCLANLFTYPKIMILPKTKKN